MTEGQEGEDTFLNRPDFPSATTHEQREANWRAMGDYLDHITDRLGLPIDEGIKNPVIALNLLDVNTTGSCEGHVDHGIPAPWIDIEAKGNEAVEAKLDELGKEIDKLEAEGNASADLDQLYERYRQEALPRDNANQAEVQKVEALLEAFYRDRSIPLDRELILQIAAAKNGRLISRGAESDSSADERARQQKLAEYQEEMQFFATFLKEIYFG